MNDREKLESVIEKCIDLLKKLKEVDSKKRVFYKFQVNKSAINRSRIIINEMLRDCEKWQ